MIRAAACDEPVSRLDPGERRQELVTRRLAELVAQKDWRLLETGRFLHDDLGQLLTAAGIRLDLLAQHSSSEELILLQDLLEQCMLRVRTKSDELNRSTADRLGLKPALERLIDKWSPALRFDLNFSCPDRLKLPLSQSRVVVGVAEFAFEVGANHPQCRRLEVKAKVTTRKCTVSAHLFGVKDPLNEPESEVLWRILKAAAALAGGTLEISVAFRTEDVTIMRAEFPTKFPTEFSTGAAEIRNRD